MTPEFISFEVIGLSSVAGRALCAASHHPKPRASSSSSIDAVAGNAGAILRSIDCVTLLAQSGERRAQAVRLPTGRLLQLSKARSVRPLEQL